MNHQKVYCFALSFSDGNGNTACVTGVKTGLDETDTIARAVSDHHIGQLQSAGRTMPLAGWAIAELTRDVLEKAMAVLDQAEAAEAEKVIPLHGAPIPYQPLPKLEPVSSDVRLPSQCLRCGGYFGVHSEACDADAPGAA